MSELTFPDLPADLAARLDAAGATDDAGLRRALDADPELRRDYEAFLAANQEQNVGAMMGQLLAAFLAVHDAQALAEFWGQVPLELEDPFIAMIEERISEAEQASDAELAGGLRQRLDGLRQLQAQQQAVTSLIERSLAGLETAGDDELPPLWQEIPLELEDAFLAAAEGRAVEAEHAGDTERAARLRARIEALRALQAAQRGRRDAPPTVRALIAFLQAEGDDAARQIFADRRDLLQPYEAQRMLDGLIQQAPVELRERAAGRSALLPELRGATAQTLNKSQAAAGSNQPATVLQSTLAGPGTTHFSNQNLTIEGGLNQAGGDIHVYNTTNISLLERRWIRPQPPGLTKAMVPRRQDLKKVIKLLERQGRVAISGRTSALAVQGMAGIGKTTLANMLALDLDQRYPDGVIWEPIGPDIRRRDDVQSILNKWALQAVVGPGPGGASVQFEPDAVRTLLGEHPRLLVVLDNVWSLDAIRPLRDALPPAAHLLITTRSKEVLIDLGGQPYELGVLSPSDARRLVGLRLHRRLKQVAGWPWVDQLTAGIGYHTLALDVALGLLSREGERPEEWQKTAQRVIDHVYHGKGFADLHLKEDDREHNVELVLSYSYETIDRTAQRYFRLLGACALDAEFSTAMTARLWGCDEETARQRLNDFVNAALLSRTEAVGRWHQHGLLRGYALALLHREGEYEAAAARHAATYGDAIREADDAGRFYLMRLEYPQLRHAFAWAVANDLSRAQGLIGDCAGLQGAFGFARDSLGWCEEALAAARRRGSPADVARAHGSLGNALQRVAALPGEDRRARLLSALKAYDKALRFYTPETAPLDYAATQNNRANLLSAIATLAGEDRRARLLSALAAYDEALRFRTPETAPLAYAMTQGNLLNLHQAMTDLPGEDRWAHLSAALRAGWTAFTLFVTLHHSEFQERAAGQLQDLREACGEDFAALWAELGVGLPPEWLDQAAPDLPAALKARLDAAGVTDEESLRRALDADPELKSDLEAFFAASQAQTVQAQMRQLLAQFLAVSDGNTLVEFWRQVPLELEEAFIAAVESQIAQAEQEGVGDLVEALRSRLDGLRHLRAAQQVPAENDTIINEAFFAFLNARSIEDLRALLDDNSPLLSEAVEPLFDTMLEQYTGNQEVLALLEMRRALLKACREQGVEPVFAQLGQAAGQMQQAQQFQQALDRYLELCQAAEQSERDVVAWQAAAEAGEALLVPEFAETPGVDWEGLKAHLAITLNNEGNARDDGGDKVGALAAFERAIALQPDAAMWRRNRAGTLIDLGRLDEAAEEIAAARALEPEAPRLAELDAALAQARVSVPGAAQEDN